MEKHFDRQLQAAKRWARESCTAGWLAEADITPLEALENRSPANLFEAGAHRPLVVAFFGGTGVGKSSLLNRLAGREIARVGVERPTSREVSIFLHESLQLRQLPAGFPVDRVRVATHHDNRRRQVLWIDMPDIDSTEADNRTQVINWLPHIDLVVYVVSPERYRDDKGWRMLKEQVQEHAWLFVMNQWDRGQPVQIEDFAKLLRQGGFGNPLIFRTDCREQPQARKADDFDDLEAGIQALADSHLIEQLESRVHQARHRELQATIDACLERMGDTHALETLNEQWSAIWHNTESALQEGLEWPLKEIARSYVSHDANPLRKRIRLDRTEPAPAQPASPSVLWDDWAQMQLQDAQDRLLIDIGDCLPVVPLRRELLKTVPNASKLMLAETQRCLRQALAKPGGPMRRFFLGFAGLCALLLPLAAIGWVSWQLVTAYYASALTHDGYLGVDFAIHSGLLIAIAWLLPFFVVRQLKPSIERTAEQGLRTGVGAALALIRDEFDAALDRYNAGWRQRLEEGRRIAGSSDAAQLCPRPPVDALLARMLPNGDAVKARETD